LLCVPNLSKEITVWAQVLFVFCILLLNSYQGK